MAAGQQGARSSSGVAESPLRWEAVEPARALGLRALKTHQAGPRGPRRETPILTRTVLEKGGRMGKGAERELVPQSRVGLGGRRPGAEGTQACRVRTKRGSRRKESGDPGPRHTGRVDAPRDGGARAEGPPGEGPSALGVIAGRPREAWSSRTQRREGEWGRASCR